MKNKKIAFTTLSQINKVLQQNMGYTMVPSTIEQEGNSLATLVPHKNIKGDCSNLVDFEINGQWGYVCCKNELGRYEKINLLADNYHLLVVEYNEHFVENNAHKEGARTATYDGYALTDLSAELQEANKKEYGLMYDRYLLANIKREKRSEIAEANNQIRAKNLRVRELSNLLYDTQAEIDELNYEKESISYKYSQKEEDLLNSL